MTDAPHQHSALDARDDMLAIANTWPDLTARLGRDGTSAPDGMPKPVTRTRGLVINELVSQTMADIREWVTFLARQLVDETDWTPPAGTDTPGLITNIARQRIGFFTEHKDVELRVAFIDDCKKIRADVTRVAYPDGYRTLDTRLPCETTDNCPGAYTVRPSASGAMPDLVCSHDRTHRVGPDVWSRTRWRHVHDSSVA